jgi:hypothetical protein
MIVRGRGGASSAAASAVDSKRSLPPKMLKCTSALAFLRVAKDAGAGVSALALLSAGPLSARVAAVGAVPREGSVPREGIRCSSPDAAAASSSWDTRGMAPTDVLVFDDLRSSGNGGDGGDGGDLVSSLEDVPRVDSGSVGRGLSGTVARIVSAEVAFGAAPSPELEGSTAAGAAAGGESSCSMARWCFCVMAPGVLPSPPKTAHHHSRRRHSAASSRQQGSLVSSSSRQQGSLV